MEEDERLEIVLEAASKVGEAWATSKLSEFCLGVESVTGHHFMPVGVMHRRTEHTVVNSCTRCGKLNEVTLKIEEEDGNMQLPFQGGAPS